jgi:hypothetical protein
VAVPEQLVGLALPTQSGAPLQSCPPHAPLLDALDVLDALDAEVLAPVVPVLDPPAEPPELAIVAPEPQAAAPARRRRGHRVVRSLRRRGAFTRTPYRDLHRRLAPTCPRVDATRDRAR